MNGLSAVEYSVMPAAAANLTARGRGKPVNAGIQQRRQDLAHAVGAEIGHQDAVAVLHAAIVADRRWA